MKLHRSSKSPTDIMAAEEDLVISEDELDDAAEDTEDLEGVIVEDDTTITDNLEELSENVEDLQEQIDDIPQQDEIVIEIDNNISDHYIAECDYCHGVFISAVVSSDQEVESINGVCPLCNHESVQSLKWVIKAV